MIYEKEKEGGGGGGKGGSRAISKTEEVNAASIKPVLYLSTFLIKACGLGVLRDATSRHEFRPNKDALMQWTRTSLN